MADKKQPEPVKRLTRDLRAAAVRLSKEEARYLVDSYYQMQADRIRTSAQIRSMDKEPHMLLGWLAEQSRTLEDQIKGALDRYTLDDPVGEWMRAQIGVGPVIAAGFMAHLDVTKSETAGGFWRFCGQDPSCEWKKGQKRPWNATMKVLCWKLGESFVKVSGKEDAFYAQFYVKRKEQEVRKNEAGDFADQAATQLENKNYRKDTATYGYLKDGKLSPAHIHRRACRYAVHMFLAHLHHIMYVEQFKKEPPLPYPIVHQGHAHYIAPPPGA